MYPLMGLPPSLVGGSQARVIESSVVPSHSGSPGLPGGSEIDQQQVAIITVARSTMPTHHVTIYRTR